MKYVLIAAIACVSLAGCKKEYCYPCEGLNGFKGEICTTDKNEYDVVGGANAKWKCPQ